MWYASSKKIILPLVLGLLFLCTTNLQATQKVINPERYEWITQTSPSLNDYLHTYFDAFKNQNLQGFIHVDFLTTDNYDAEDEKWEYTLETKESQINAKLIQGHFALGVKELFFLNSGIEVPTQNALNAGNFDAKEYALASYHNFGSLHLLGSAVYKTQPLYEEVDGVKYFKDTSNATQSSTSFSLMGSFAFLGTGVFYDTQRGLEKFYLQLNQKTPLGELSLTTTNGRLPFAYNNITLNYLYENKNGFALKAKSDYRFYEDATNRNDGIVNTQIEFEQTLPNQILILRASLSSNKEFSQKELYGYKVYAEFAKFYFMGFSKNYAQDLARLPLQDTTLMQIGLKFSFYDN